MDMKEKKLTVIGAVDPIGIVTKLRKYWPTTDIVLVGPATEPEKLVEKKETDQGAKQKEEPKKEGGGSREAKEEAKNEGDGKKEEIKATDAAVPVYDPVHEMVKAYIPYSPQMTSYYYVQSMEENPNACVVCWT